MGAPAVGTVVGGYRFDGGNHRDKSNWTQVEAVDVSREHGPGAQRLPSGQVIRIGVKGGVTDIKTASDGGAAPDIKEFQANAAARATLMDQGANDYAAARAAGYNPTSFWNGLARSAEGLPIVGVPLSNVMRTDVADKGRAAELQFVDGALRTTSGANAPEPEMVRADRSYFLAPGEADSVETGKAQLRDRFRNQAVRIAGEAYIAPPGSAGEAGDPGPLSENGLPSYLGIAKLTEGVRETPLPEGGYGAPDPTPGASPDQPFDFVGASREDTIAAIQRGGWFRQGPDGEPYQLPPSAPEFAREEGDQRVSDGVYVRPQGAEDAAKRYQSKGDTAQRGDSFILNAADTLSFGLADEAVAGIDAALGRGSGDSFGDRYQSLVGTNRDWKDAATKDHPVSGGAGMVAGAVAAPGGIAAGKFVASAPKLGYAMTRGGAVGAGYGAAYGAGNAEGGLAERGQGALSGLMTGGVTGAALPPLARGVSMVASPITRPVGNFVGETLQRFRGSPMTGVDRAARDLTQGVSLDDMEAQVANMRRFGAEPTIADAGGSVVQSRTRVAATRQTPGRQAAENFATGRRGEVQDFTQGLAQRVSPIEATPAQLDVALKAHQRAASQPAFDAVRGERVQLDPSSVMALRGEEGRSAIRQAARLFGSSVDEQERNVAAELNQLADTLLDQPNTEISVGAADLLSRYLNKAGGADANAQRVFGEAGRAVRQNARDQVSGYGDALDGYAQRARLGKSVSIGDHFVGNKGHPADFVQAVEGMDPAQRKIAAAAGRAGLERAAGTGRGAPGVLDSIATDRNMQRKASALLGKEGADELRQGAEVGRQLMMTGHNVNPRAGSNTFLNSQDGEAQKAGNIAGNVLTGRFGEAIGGAIDLLKSRGMSDQQAETLISLATDPSRTDEVLSILRQRGFGEQESLRLVERMVPQLSGAAGAAQAPQQPRIRMAG